MAQPAGYVLISGVTCFLVWLLLFAPVLQHNAQAGPLGLRRTAALDFVGPVAALSRLFRIDDASDAANQALGRPETGPDASQSVPPAPEPPSKERSGDVQPDADGTAEGPVLPKPTEAHPLNVLVVGDSLAIGLGTYLSATLANAGVFKSHMDARISTGLSRPDYFNWPVQIRFDIAKYNPDIVVIMTGGNDPQPLLSQGHGVAVNTAQWLELYAKRVDLMEREAAAGGRQVVWVGLPITNKGGLTWAYKRQNTVYRSVSASHPRFARYIDIWRLFQNAAGHYAPYLADPHGHLVLMRAPDGVHMTPAGYQRLSTFVFSQMKPMWKKTAGASPAPTGIGTPSPSPGTPAAGPS